MLVVEIVLIIIGIICICISFFVAGKKRTEETEKTEEHHGADLWTKKDEEIVIKHIDEILERRGMELVETTEDQMNRICNEKIMAIDEFSKPLLDKIHVNHEEVVFMYNMLGEKQKELQKTMEEDTNRKAVPPIEEVPTAPSEEIINRLPLVTDDEPEPEKERVVDTSMTGLERAGLKADISHFTQIKRKEPKEPMPELSTGKPVKPVEMVGASQGNQIGPSRAALQDTSQTLTGIQRLNPDINPAPPMQVETVEPEKPEPPKAIPKEQLKRPTREFVMQHMEETAGNGRGESVEDRVRILYKQGKSVVEISKALNIGQGEVKLMIAMYNKRR